MQHAKSIQSVSTYLIDEMTTTANNGQTISLSIDRSRGTEQSVNHHSSISEIADKHV